MTSRAGAAGSAACAAAVVSGQRANVVSIVAEDNKVAGKPVALGGMAGGPRVVRWASHRPIEARERAIASRPRQ